MHYYTVESLGPSRELTPEGYLLAKGVPIARTGVMLYAAGEVPVTPAADGLVRVERDAAEVFHQNTIASFEGKPICLDHPSVDVTPENWGRLAKGVVQNVRRGAGLEDEYLLADLLITDAAAIREVRDGLREVSCGYDADYQEIEPGRGRQTNIVGNHLALVEKGRCGSRCAIGDSMKNKFFDKLRAAFKNRDEKAFEQSLSENVAMDDAESEEEKKKREEEESKKKTDDALTKVADRLAAIDARLSALETKDRKAKDEDEEEDDEDEKKKKKESKTGDAAALADELKATVARAEILAPGLHLPTLDGASSEKTRDALCGLRRKALTAASEGKYRDAVAAFGTPAQFKTMTCDALAQAFVGAAELAKRANNAQVTFDGGAAAGRGANLIAEINRRNAEFYKR